MNTGLPLALWLPSAQQGDEALAKTMRSLWFLAASLQIFFECLPVKLFFVVVVVVGSYLAQSLAALGHWYLMGDAIRQCFS